MMTLEEAVLRYKQLLKHMPRKLGPHEVIDSALERGHLAQQIELRAKKAKRWRHEGH